MDKIYFIKSTGRIKVLIKIAHFDFSVSLHAKLAS